MQPDQIILSSVSFCMCVCVCVSGFADWFICACAHLCMRMFVCVHAQQFSELLA